MNVFHTNFSCIRVIALGLSMLQFINVPLEVTASNASIDTIENYTINDYAVESESEAASLSLDQTSLTLNRDDSIKLSANVLDQNGTPIDIELSWYSDDSSIVSVEQDGTIYAESAGTTTVYVSTENLSASCDVTVTVPLTGLLFEESEIELEKGKTQHISLSLTPYDTTEYDEIIWKSSDSNIVNVTQDGMITAVNAGSASITATSGTYEASCTVVVVIPIESVSIIDSVKELKKNQQATLHASVLPENTTADLTLKWESSDNDIIFVDSNGNITALKAGTATITVTTSNNIQDSIKITVTNKEWKTGWQTINGQTYYYNENGEMQTGWLTYNDQLYYFQSNGQMKTGWLKLSNKWYYFNSDGSAAIGKKKIGNQWYLFNNNGIMTVGWRKYENIWYYANSSGYLQHGWLSLNNSWYYLNSDYEMQTGWITLSGKKYYLNSSGVMQKGWLKSNNKWYYLTNSGSIYSGWLTQGSKKYYFYSNGEMQTGWIAWNNQWHYYDLNGNFVKGWLKLGSTWYYLQSNGVMKTGWLKLGSTWYYLQSGGAMTTGWLKLGSTWYYFTQSGAMATGWLKLGSTYYYLQSGGAMKTGWLKQGSTWYYLQSSGAMATGWLKVGSIWYYFAESGAMQSSSTTGPLIFRQGSTFKISKCTASITGDTSALITIEANRNSSLEQLSSTYYLLTLNSIGTELINVSVADTSTGGTFKISSSITSSNQFRDTNMNRYAIAIKKGISYEVLSNTSFLTNTEDFASTGSDYYWGYYEDNDKISSKKGIQGVDNAYTYDLRVQHVLLNVDIQDLIWIKPYAGYKSYTYRGKTYYFSDLKALKKTIRDLHGWGDDDGNAYGENHNRSVTLVLLLSWKYNELSYLIHPSARTKGAAPYYSLNMQDASARETYEALFCYLGEELGQKKERVTNWTLGNELNSCNAWNYAGSMSFNNYVSNYAQAFQLLNQGVKQTAKSPRLFISLDHCWNTADAGYTGKQFLDQFAAYMYQTAPTIQWNVNYHSYAQPLTNTAFWNDSSNTQNSVNTPYISMKNIQVLTNYLSTLESKYGLESNSIRVILGEIGFSGTGGNSSSEQYQAAALGYGYYIAMFNTRIDSYIIRAYLDDSAETAAKLYLGLRRNNNWQTEKKAYSVYKNLDTEDSLKYMNPYLKLIGISSWESAIPGFDSSKLPAIGF